MDDLCKIYVTVRQFEQSSLRIHRYRRFAVKLSSLAALKTMSSSQCRDDYAVGKLTRFEVMFRDYLNGQIDWPLFKPKDIVRLRERFNLTQEALGTLLRVSPKTVLRWETEGETIPNTARIALCTIEKLGPGIFELMNPEIDQYDLLATSGRSDDLVGDLEESAHYNLRAQRLREATPDPFDAKAVGELRSRLRMTRGEFAKLLGVSQSTTDKWENGSIQPKGPALTILKILWTKGVDALP